MRRFCSIAAIAAVVTLVGCAAPKELAEARFNSGVVCCKSFDQLPYQGIVAGTTVRVDVDTRSLAFDFPEGMSRFVAFQVPSEDGVTWKLRVKTTIVGTHMPEAFVFYPGITFLDAHHQQLQYMNPKMTFEGGFMATTETMGWVTEVMVPSAAHYFILHVAGTSPGQLHYKEGVESAPGSIVPIGKSAMYLPGNWWDVYLPTAWAGRLQITLVSPSK
jgi:hypothetical protein